MKSFYPTIILLLSLIACTRALTLDYRVHTIDNLGLCLAAPVLFDNFIVAKSCSEKYVNFINAKSHKIVAKIDLNFEPTINKFKIDDRELKFIELEDEVIILQDITTKQFTLVSGRKSQNSPREELKPMVIDDVSVVYTYENGTLSIDVTDLSSKQPTQKLLIFQRGLSIKSTSTAQQRFDINQQYVASIKWGSDTVSIIDKKSDTSLATIILGGKYPSKPLVVNNKIYICDYGNGTMRVIEILDN